MFLYDLEQVHIPNILRQNGSVKWFCRENNFMNADFKQEIYIIADEMRGIATFEDKFGNIHQKERARRLIQLAAKLAALVDDDYDESELLAIFDKRPLHRISPVSAVDAAVFNEAGEILLIQRADNAMWAMPGGLAEIGQTLAESCVRELWEEAGLKGRVVRNLGIFDGRLWGSYSNLHLINLVFQVECDDLTPSPGIEALDAKFFSRDNLPANMDSNHAGRVPKTFEMFDKRECYLDLTDYTQIVLDDLQRPSLD
jgi:ADP-ribose pyrophosphatase YjhB (NUDIX family)